MSGALQHTRTRMPGLINPNLAPALIWQTNWSNTDGSYNVTTVKTGAEVTIDWGDGFFGSGDDTHTYADSSTKTVKVTSSDGFGGLTQFSVNYRKGLGPLPTPSGCSGLTHYAFEGNGHTGTIPSFKKCTSLLSIQLHDGNQCSGTLPSFSSCTSLVVFDLRGNLVSGTLPSFSACTALQKFYVANNSLSSSLPSFNACTSMKEFLCGVNSFSGTLPNFAACTALEMCQGQENGFTGYTSGSFATQANLWTIKFNTNSWGQAAVDACLADCVTSLGLGGRVTCTVELNGAGMSAPSSMTDHNTLEAAGWTVDVN